MFKDLIVTMQQGADLSEAEISAAVALLVDEGMAAEAKADFLTALARKGETAAEIAAFARSLREKSILPPLDAETRSREILDVCGTGGDRLNTFNISSTVSLVVASAGVTVAKHGNRAITSQTGSAQVLEALGIPVNLTPEEAARSLKEHHFAFFFAPQYHPAYRHIGPARKLCADRGQRTIFNFLGPLLNPAQPTAQLLGVSQPQLCEPLGRVLQMLGSRRAMVVSGRIGEANLDELSTLGDNNVAEFYQDRGFAVSTLSPSHFHFQPATLADLQGGDCETNAKIVRRLLEGSERGPKRDAVLFNAGAALFLAGKTRALADGIEMAAELIDSSKAAAKLQSLSQLRS